MISSVLGGISQQGFVDGMPVNTPAVVEVWGFGPMFVYYIPVRTLERILVGQNHLGSP